MQASRIFTALFVTALSLAASSSSHAAPLDVVNVAAPGINCVFDNDCRITVSDHTDQIVIPGTSGAGFLQSRRSAAGAAEAGTPAAGLYMYQYRVDIRNVVGITHNSCVNSLSIPFPGLRAVDYNGDRSPDQVFVVTQGGLGTVNVISADVTGDVVTLNFARGLCSGATRGGGATTYFIGMASTLPPGEVVADLRYDGSNHLELSAMAPKRPERAKRGFIRGDSNNNGTVELGDAIYTLSFLFRGADAPKCADAADANDDGNLDMSDAIAELQFLFLGGQSIPAPYPSCGEDPTRDRLGCDQGTCEEEEKGCPDPAATAIDFEILSQSSPFNARVRIVASIENIGSGDWVSRRGQQIARLYQVNPGGRPIMVAERDFTNLPAGDSFELTYIRAWNRSSPAEGEFPPEYRVAISYDPDIFIDGLESNDDCGPSNNNNRARSGSAINSMIR